MRKVDLILEGTKIGEVSLEQLRAMENLPSRLDPAPLIAVLCDLLIEQERKRTVSLLRQYGYFGIGDIQYWHSQDPDDPEPKGLLEWYSAYDDAIWEEIDNLQNKTFEELKDYDPVEVEQKIFEQTKGKLPPMEG